ncbi:CinA family protein [Comamonas thiooxydans]|uniref:Competence damage-inducible protein A n=1 Tax=Comamonas thiooxydans TaxID=363952 RepID=A0A0E3C0E1_9BURK|nr:CinA family protein [Comamonas thiooxydans]KGH14084.1 competence damage-inducible protein A [Comamonas thiooxydans]KGH16937.1 competence damage-inducible protein A [Comamonas thiooxydans]KGH21525.1 competence damage-inducible protein A [Comamonas thiooxydans]
MSTQETNIEELVRQLAARLTEKGWMLATAESCTGGMIAAACTDLAGSSQWFERGFVTYSNEAKTEMLGVPAELIAKHGAVSEEVVRAMAEGAIRHSRAQVSIAVTGIAGPSGGSAEKPVGTVWVGWYCSGALQAMHMHLNGSRSAIRATTVVSSLNVLIDKICLESAI